MTRKIIKSDNEKWWYGVPGIRMIWHGEWSDPELECDGYVANYWDVENTMYEYALEDGIDADNDDVFAQYVRDHADDAKYLVTECGTKEEDDDFIDSGCHGKDEKDKKKKPVKSSMPGKEKGIQAIMDEYGCTREEAIEIMNEEIQNSRKPVKSSFAGFDDFDSFASYAEAHYLPILDKVSEEGYQITRDDARLLSFLHDDLVSLVNNGFDL